MSFTSSFGTCLNILLWKGGWGIPKFPTRTPQKKTKRQKCVKKRQKSHNLWALLQTKNHGEVWYRKHGWSLVTTKLYSEFCWLFGFDWSQFDILTQKTTLWFWGLCFFRPSIYWKCIHQAPFIGPGPFWEVAKKQLLAGIFGLGASEVFLSR